MTSFFVSRDPARDTAKTINKTLDDCASDVITAQTVYLTKLIGQAPYQSIEQYSAAIQQYIDVSCTGLLSYAINVAQAGGDEAYNAACTHLLNELESQMHKSYRAWKNKVEVKR